MERHPIPQNIMDVEFKLFGSLTFKQFGSLFIFFFFALFIYLLKLPAIISWPLMGLFIFIGLGMAFLQIGGQPFGKWLSSFLIAVITPQRLVWKKESHVPKALTKKFEAPTKVKKKVTSHDLLTENVLSKVLSEEVDERITNYEDQILGNIDRYFDGGEQVPNTKKVEIERLPAQPGGKSEVQSEPEKAIPQPKKVEKNC